ncbi:TPA: hypothetical protein NJQ91_000640 [Staphylococcus aureus]|nr:hypothetical protein [Staphylococcus aureus]
MTMVEPFLNHTHSVWFSFQQREIGFPISTDSASWGGTTIKKYFFYRN